MMDGHGKSDRPVVPGKPPNKEGHRGPRGHGRPYSGTKAETPDTDKGMPTVPPAPGGSTAEGVEGRGLAKGNPRQHTTPRTQGRVGVHGALERVRQAAREDGKLRFTALLHHVYDPAMLREAYFCLKREAAPGVDRVTWRQYGEALEDNLQDLSARLKRGAYRAKPVRRAYIAKADGRQRPLGMTALEDTGNGHSYSDWRLGVGGSGHDYERGSSLGGIHVGRKVASPPGCPTAARVTSVRRQEAPGPSFRVWHWRTRPLPSGWSRWPAGRSVSASPGVLRRTPSRRRHPDRSGPLPTPRARGGPWPATGPGAGLGYGRCAALGRRPTRPRGGRRSVGTDGSGGVAGHGAAAVPGPAETAPRRRSIDLSSSTPDGQLRGERASVLSWACTRCQR